MSTSHPVPRASPYRLKTSAKTALDPAQIPLPPSPPASGGLLISNRFAPRLSSSPERARRTLSQNKSSATKTFGRDKLHLAESNNDPQLPLNITSTRTRSKRSRVAREQFDSSSPPTSPTNRKSTRSSKRLKLASPSPSRRSSLHIPVKSEQRDSPNNPFLVKPGERPRRADSRRNDGHRQLIYVFRGKRLPYSTIEDLDEAGGSPFNLSGPKLLFPSPPSPAPVPKLKFQLEEPVDEGSSVLTSPQRRNQDRSQFEFQTPKRDKTKSNLAAPVMLPTPQSRPRRTQAGYPGLPNEALTRVVKSSRTMAKAMR